MSSAFSAPIGRPHASVAARRVPALAIPRGRLPQPPPASLRSPVMSDRKPGRPGRVRELHELPLVELPRLAGRVSRRRALVPLAPVHSRRLGSTGHGRRRLAHPGRGRGGGARDGLARAARRRPRLGGAGARTRSRGAPARGLPRRRRPSSSTPLPAPRPSRLIWSSRPRFAQTAPKRATTGSTLARRGGPLGRRAARRDVEGGRARPRLRSVGGPSGSLPARRRTSSRSSSRPRATSPNSASTT